MTSSSGKEHNFKNYDDTLSSSLGVPYDYGSVMHYSKTSFNIGSEPTIVTKIPQFMDVIGQRMGFSASDLTKLNSLYNCSESLPLPIHEQTIINNLTAHTKTVVFLNNYN